MDASKLYEENLERIKRTMRFEKTDRPPVMPTANAWCSRPLGMKLAEYCARAPETADFHLKCWQSLDPVLDGVQCVVFDPRLTKLLWLSNTRIPGVDLPDDELWQVEEAELVTHDDYREIIRGGYLKWLAKFTRERLGDPASQVVDTLAATVPSIQKFIDAGIVPLVPMIVTIPFENLCGGRSLIKLMLDMIKKPDLLDEVLKVSSPEVLEANRQVLRNIRPIGCWVGGWRGASSLMSPAMWERFVWPYLKATVEMVVEEGVIPVLHLDADWTNSLDYFRELPRHKCIMSPDGATDIHKARVAMEDHMAILGDVPAAMLAFSSPREVFDYTRGLIDEFGGRGYMVSSGCDIPFNARRENVEAMMRAAHSA
jgi:hypothetical protein